MYWLLSIWIEIVNAWIYFYFFPKKKEEEDNRCL